MKKFLKQTVILVMLNFGFNISFGQISQGGTPYSFKSTLKRSDTITVSVDLIKSIPVTVMPKIREQAIDSIKQNNLLFEEHQFAFGFNVDINVKIASATDSLDVGLLYRMSIKSEGAKSLNLIFKKYILPKGSKLYIYSKDQQNIIGAFTSNNNKQSERLPTLPVFGDEVTVEYFEPYFADFDGQLIIGEVNHDFIGVVSTEGKIDDDFGSSGDCQVDINCSEGNNWQTEKRAVCRIVKDGKTHCSGALLNNVNYDGIPYFLTANHCISTQSEADDCICIFNYESPSCNGGDGSTSQSIAAGTLRATRQQSDFTLLEFSNRPLSSWNPYYAGWDRNDNQGAGGVGIHHPAGDVKKISTYNVVPPNSVNCFDDRPNDNFYRITWLATANGHGVTEGGSSGSPLFNSDRRVIGQLYGAGLVANCPNPNCSDPANDNSNYGKIFASWDLGGSSNNQLQNWLDPSNSNLTVLDGANVCSQGTVELNLTHTVNSGVVEIQQATKTITSTSHIKSGATVTYEAGKSITLEPRFVAEAGSNFTASIKSSNCVPGCYPMTLQIINTRFSNGGNLCFNQTNAKIYSFKLFTVSGKLVLQSSGNTSNFKVCVPTPNDLGIGTYIVSLTLNSECEELSETYSVVNLSEKSTKSAKTTDSTNTSSNNELLQNISIENRVEKFDFEIYPNPTDGNFSIEIKSKEISQYSFEIINSVGTLIYKIEINKTNFPSGTYYVRINNGKNIVTKKMIVQ